MACGVVINMGRVFNNWSEVEEVLDALNTFMRPLARPGKGLEDYGDVAIFTIASGKVVIRMNWGMEGSKYVLERFGIEFSDEYCIDGYCRAVFTINRAYNAGKRELIDRGLARLAGIIEDSGNTTKYVIGGLVISLGWVGDVLGSVSFEAGCLNPGTAGG